MCLPDDKLDSNLIEEKQMEVVIFNNSEEARRAMAVKMYRYEQWCNSMGRNADDDENWISFCEGYGNQ